LNRGFASVLLGSSPRLFRYPGLADSDSPAASLVAGTPDWA
jgi:hypothetical protein